MEEQRIDLLVMDLGVIRLGKSGEGKCKAKRFMTQAWRVAHPDAQISLHVTPPKGTPYLAALDEDADGSVLWTITDADTAFPGPGVIELILSDPATDMTIKSVTGRTIVDESPSQQEPEEPPEPHRPWWERVLQLIAMGSGTGGTGVSPTISVETITGGHRLTITDVLGTKTVDVMDGKDGAPGMQGAAGDDGVSPTVSVEAITGGHRVTITDKDGAKSFDVMDGQNGSGGGSGAGIDDTLASTTTTYSSSKIDELLNKQKEAIVNQATLDGNVLTFARDGVSKFTIDLSSLNTGGSGGSDTPTPPPSEHGIIWDLVAVTSNNPITSVSDGASLIAVLTAADGYTLGDVTVTMGGEVVTGAWNADTATIMIMSVTGDVVISCAGVEQTGPVDTSPKIAQYDTAYGTDKTPVAWTGLCVTEIYPYTPDIDAIKAGTMYDEANDCLKTAGEGASLVVYTPSLKARAIEGFVATSMATKGSKIIQFRDGTAVTYYSNASLTATESPATAKISNNRNITDCLYANGFAFTLATADIDDSYAYWNQITSAFHLPVGVRHGDIIFAGKNTEYYGFANIDGTKAGQETASLSYDDDIAQNYAAATTSILGEETNSNPSSAYGVSAEMAAVIDEARKAWMIEYGGDYRRIPIIVSTDQHGRRSTGIFNMIGKTINMHDVSRICNLGDTVSNWVDSDPEHPLLSDAGLQAWLESIEAIPFSKRLDVFGNHDTWYSNYADEGNPIGTRYPSSQAHLYQYFRNIYPRRLNSNGWFVDYDDAFNVKYVVISGFEYQGSVTFRIGKAQMKWLIEELEKDDGYNVVIVSHVPLHYKTGEMSYPFAHEDTVTQDYRVSELDTDAFFAARKTGGRGTITDSDGVEHSYDFSKVNNSPLLCAIHGHTHIDAYTHVGNELLSYSFDWFDDSTIFFALIDSVNSCLNIWKISAPDSVPQVENYQVPFDQPLD